MAKDRTRHARRRVPKHHHALSIDNGSLETVTALDGIINGTAQALVDFTDTISGAVSDFAEKYRRLTDGRD